MSKKYQAASAEILTPSFIRDKTISELLSEIGFIMQKIEIRQKASLHASNPALITEIREALHLNTVEALIKIIGKLKDIYHQLDEVIK